MRGEEIAPHDNVPVFDIRQARINVFFLGVGFRRAEKAIQVRRIGFILPMVLESGYVDLRALARGLGGLERRRHASISPERPHFAPATLSMRLDVISHRTIKETR